MRKVLIFDSSTLISLTMNGLLEELRELWKVFGGTFLITREVKYEIIDRPIKIDRFALEALQIQELLDERILALPHSLGLNDENISQATQKVLQETNAIFQTKGHSVHLIDLGEASCLAANKFLLEQGYQGAIAVDERTTRLLGEKPENLRQLMEKRLHAPVKQIRTPPAYGKYTFFRSSELMYVAYKLRLTRLKGPKVLYAMLYGLKFKGCAISDEEIQEMKKI